MKNQILINSIILAILILGGLMMNTKIKNLENHLEALGPSFPVVIPKQFIEKAHFPVTFIPIKEDDGIFEIFDSQGYENVEWCIAKNNIVIRCGRGELARKATLDWILEAMPEEKK